MDELYLRKNHAADKYHCYLIANVLKDGNPSHFVNDWRISVEDVNYVLRCSNSFAILSSITGVILMKQVIQSSLHLKSCKAWSKRSNRRDKILKAVHRQSSGLDQDLLWKGI